MAEPFQTEKKFFLAMSSYVALLQSLTSVRAYSGATRLYLLTGLGVTLAAGGDLELLRKNLAEDDTIVEPPLSYIKSSIAATCSTYAMLLGEHIKNRLETRGDQDIPTGDEKGPRLSYNIPNHLAVQLKHLVDPAMSANELWNKPTLFQNLADMMQIEYAHTASVEGRLVPNARQDAVLMLFVSRLRDLFSLGDILTYDPREFHMPVLKTLLVIARLLYADFRDAHAVPELGTIRPRLWISNSTLAAMPWPSPAFVEGFEEKEAGVISSEGWRYLNRITDIYPDRL